MYTKRFEPIGDKCHEIIEYVMASPDIPSQDDLIFKIRLSIEEVIENIVQYAYENGSGFLEVSTQQEDGVLYIRFTDAGTPFNPLDKPDPDISLSAEDRPIGGLGIFISKQMMDKIEYKFKDGCNVLTMSKRVIPA